LDPARRFDGLPAAAVERLQAAERALRARDAGAALQAARAAAQLAPEHAETQRSLARILSSRGPSAEALALIRRAAAARPDDALMQNTLGVVLDVNRLHDAALAAFRRACALAPDSADYAYNLGRALTHHGDADDSRATLERALALEPGHWPAAAALIEVLRQGGHSDAAVAQCRRLLQRDPGDARVWSALAGLRNVRFEAADVEAMARAEARPDLDLESSVRLGFALAKGYEDKARYAEAFAAYGRANARMRSVRPWDASAHAREVDALLAAFAQVPDGGEPDFGAGVIFVVSLPRAGSSLVEQILASHAQVEGGGERMDLLGVIAEEGQRLRLPLAQWAPQASAADWRRLGERYLQRTAALRTQRPYATDKLPGNWLWLGAAMAMLPGARVVECRRDPLETAWSCYCQLFAAANQDFSYDLDSIAAFVHDYERSMQHWHRLYPARIRVQRYESLLADFEDEVRALLAACGLDFDPACLRFHENRRRVRTISSTQVREPLRRDRARTAGYGALRDPLRQALAARAGTQR
jgi:Flp pilus assembly protein TadD